MIAWALASACFTGHLAHILPWVPGWFHILASTPVHGAMSALALLGESSALCLGKYATCPIKMRALQLPCMWLKYANLCALRAACFQIISGVFQQVLR